MERHAVKIKSKRNVTHDVIQVTTDRPGGYTFVPGQAAELSINKDGWVDERRPFTFTSLPEDDHLEFTIKVYPEHNGMTNQLLQAKDNDELFLHEVFGAISYKGEGTFIAGGAGVTPFISIFKHLQNQGCLGNNKLIFANKTSADIILEDWFSEILGDNFINILSDEKTAEYAHGFISKEFLADHIGGVDQHFYICGPEPMMDAIEGHLQSLKADPASIIKEQF